MKKWIAIVLIFAIMSGLVGYADEIEVEDDSIITGELEIEETEEGSVEDELLLDDAILIDEDISSLELPDLSIDDLDPEQEVSDIYTPMANGVPGEAVSWNGHYYQLFDLDDVTTWESAEAYCESLGGYLATITSAEEDAFLYNNIVRAAGYQDAYFGFTDKVEEDRWKWVTGEAADYTNWAGGEPSSGRAENYGLYYHKFKDGKWGDGDFRTDTSENGGKAFICEWGDYTIAPVYEGKYWCVYLEGFRNDRLEYVTFDIQGDVRQKIVYGNKELTLENNILYINDAKHYYNNGKWEVFETGYGRISDKASKVIAANLDVVNTDGKVVLSASSDTLETVLAKALIDYPQLTFPITIGNNHGTQGVFDVSLEQYILNMDSDKYYPDLAYMLMALAAAAYNDTGKQGGELTAQKAGYQSESKELYHITKAYEDLGFTDYQPFSYYNNPNDSAYGSDNAACIIGRKTLPSNEALVLIVVRGSYGNLSEFTSDWQSNTKVERDSKERHKGFSRAADKVYSRLMSFMGSRYSDAAIKSNTRYVITGHSRGAAVANLLAVKLGEAGIPNSKIYDYNFACPDTVRGFTLADLRKGHENIWNICNSGDAVSVIPGIIGDANGELGYTGLDYIIEKFKSLFTSWGKYGTTYFYCNNWNSAQEFDLSMTFTEDSSHDYRNYVLDMERRPTTFYTWAEIVDRRVRLGVPDCINRIVNIFYSGYAFDPGDITKAKVTVDDQVYTGKALKPKIVVVLNGRTLIKGTDYTVTYKNNVKIGKATVIIKGKGNRNGKYIAHFNILPPAVTGLKVKGGKGQLTASWKKGKNISGYQLQYSTNKSFAATNKPNSVTINKADTVKKTVKSLKRKRTYYVRIRSFKKVDNSKYYSAWSAIKKVTVK